MIRRRESGKRMTSEKVASEDEILRISACNIKDNLFDEEPGIVDCTLGGRYYTKAMIDNGCTGYSFIDRDMAHEVCDVLGISPVKLLKPRKVRGYNGQPGEPVTHAIYPPMTIMNHTESPTPLMKTKLGQHAVILGKPWMKKHGVSYHGHNDTVTFWPEHCTHIGSPKFPFPDLPEPPREAKETNQKEITAQPRKILKRPSALGEQSNHSRTRGSLNDSWRKELNQLTTPSPEIRTRHMMMRDRLFENRKEREQFDLKDSYEGTMDIYSIGAAPFNTLSKQKEVEIFAVSMKDVDIQLRKIDKPSTDPKMIVPTEYHDFLDVFSKEKADELPPHRKHDHRIELEEGKEAGHGYAPLYNMSEGELLLVKKYLQEHLDKGFIESSTAPYASPILFARKPGGGLRFCVDYRKLNATTKKNRYPIPLIAETIARLSKAKWITKIDIRHAFNRIRMHSKEDEDLTTFRTKYGTYKYLVMPFGLTNGPSTFQNFMNDTLMDYLDEFVVAYLDDILIYSNNKKEHTRHVRRVLQRLREAGIQADVDKCEFHMKETKFLGMIVGRDGIRMDPEKVEAVVEWNTPTQLREMQAFLKFINFYKKFIKDFSKIAKPLVNLTRKDRLFD